MNQRFAVEAEIASLATRAFERFRVFEIQMNPVEHDAVERRKQRGRKQQPTRVSASGAVSVTQSMGRPSYAAANSTFSISVASSASAFELLTRFDTVSENRKDVIQVTRNEVPAPL